MAAPLAVDGGVLVARPLNEAILLPTERNQPLFPIAAQPDERDQIDALNVYDDDSTQDKVGTLGAARLFGLGMANDLTFATTAFGEPASVPGGITFGDAATGKSKIEILNVLLGQGNDKLATTGTLNAATEGTGPARHGGITTVHGGGNHALPSGVMGGDQTTITGGGGPASPLVVYGDISQDGLWYSGNPNLSGRADTIALSAKLFDQVGTADDAFRFPRANPFTSAGNDVIDASALFAGMPDAQLPGVGIAIYGEAGNDSITGSQAGDHIAGGSGDDVIDGQRGGDLIYGDSGFNVDPITRTLLVPTTDGGYGTLPFGPVRDALVAGHDNIAANDGDDVIFGDHGTIKQDAPRGTIHPLNAAGQRPAVFGAATSASTDSQQTFTPSDKLLTVGLIQDIRTVEDANCVSDVINGGVGNDSVLGGYGGDNITDATGENVIFGDFGFISRTYANTASPIDRMATLDLSLGGPAPDANDVIVAGLGDTTHGNIIFGGSGNDAITAGSGPNNIVFGDGGEICSAATVNGTPNLAAPLDGHAITLGQLGTTDRSAAATTRSPPATATTSSSAARAPTPSTPATARASSSATPAASPRSSATTPPPPSPVLACRSSPPTRIITSASPSSCCKKRPRSSPPPSPRSRKSNPPRRSRQS